MPTPLRSAPSRPDATAATPPEPSPQPLAERRTRGVEAASSAAPLRELTDLLGSFTEQTGALFE